MGAFISSLFSSRSTPDAKGVTIDQSSATKSEETPKLLTSTSREISQRACFGAGCYWGTEKYFRYDFVKKHKNVTITNTAVGFMGPVNATANPSYREVCSGRTGHVEVFEFTFSGGSETYEMLVRYFFQFHDPTTLNKQGNDKGTQYASVIYCYDQAQLDIAARVKSELQSLLDARKLTCFTDNKVSTDIRNSTKFYPAEAEHQDYLKENPNGYCNHRIRFNAWPQLKKD